jgi:hypothetical protein
VRDRFEIVLSAWVDEDETVGVESARGEFLGGVEDRQPRAEAPRELAAIGDRRIRRLAEISGN